MWIGKVVKIKFKLSRNRTEFSRDLAIERNPLFLISLHRLILFLAMDVNSVVSRAFRCVLDKLLKLVHRRLEFLYGTEAVYAPRAKKVTEVCRQGFAICCLRISECRKRRARKERREDLYPERQSVALVTAQDVSFSSQWQQTSTGVAFELIQRSMRILRRSAFSIDRPAWRNRSIQLIGDFDLAE